MRPSKIPHVCALPAVDQLNKFNSRLADLAQGHQKHIIDGIVLTKFDTIDEKVGG